MKINKTFLFSSIVTISLISIYIFSNTEKKVLNNDTRKELGGSFIKLSDGFTHYELSGEENGQLVVLVHGGTIPGWVWNNQINVLIDSGYRVLVYDKYGRGFSDRPKVKYNQYLYKKQLIELVDKLGFTQKFNLIGISLGGGTAINFTAQYPDRVNKLILISPLINNFKTPGIFKVPVLGEFLARIAGVKTIVKRFSSLIEGSPNAEKYKKLFVEQTKYKGFQRSLLSMLRNDAVKDYSEAYKIVGKQKRDILLIWGTEDEEITKEMINDIQKYLPNVNFEPIENAGHGLVSQEYETVNSLILDFLK